MKILVLTKRQYMGKDLLDDRFGRYRELPLELAGLGHEVRAIAWSYRDRGEDCRVDGDPATTRRVNWRSVNLFAHRVPVPHRYLRHTRRRIGEFAPDLIWTGSDAYHAILGCRLARQHGTRCIVDIYDDYEAFGGTKLPGIRQLLRRAVKQADGVTFFSQRMADRVVHGYPLAKPHALILNGVKKELFHPMERSACRAELGLPRDAKIIGTAGALDSSRGIDSLFSAFARLAERDPGVHLALAGARARNQKIPAAHRVHDFHMLPQEKVPAFINALDLAVICYRQSAQGQVSFPQKAYEIIACGVPLVAAAVGSMNELLQDYPDCLYEPENASSLAAALQRQLVNRIPVTLAVPSWTDSARQLSDFFHAIAGSTTFAADAKRTTLRTL